VSQSACTALQLQVVSGVFDPGPARAFFGGPNSKIQAAKFVIVPLNTKIVLVSARIISYCYWYIQIHKKKRPQIHQYLYIFVLFGAPWWLIGHTQPVSLCLWAGPVLIDQTVLGLMTSKANSCSSNMCVHHHQICLQCSLSSTWFLLQIICAKNS